MEDLNDVITYINSLSFKEFVYEIFSHSIIDDRGFVGGKYVDECCDRLVSNQHTMEITARDHFKSTRIYAFLMWKILTAKESLEVQYFSFNEKMAGYHLEKLKDFISNNFWFNYLIANNALIDRATGAKRIIDYVNPFGAKVSINLQGMKTFTRGIHADIIIIDDPFPNIQDNHKATPTEVYNVNHIVRAGILSMIKEAGSIHIVGTPQTNNDFFFDDDLKDQFLITIKPAILDEKNKVVLWKEWYPWERLMEKKKSLKPRLFNQEFMASPVYAEDSFLNPKLIDKAIDVKLKPASKYEGTANVYAGYDIGKKTHPSHICVFKEEQGHYTQLYSQWMDKWDYIDQIELVKELIHRFSIDVVNYDATRGELEALEEQRRLPRQMTPYPLH